jgi:hypothetical protein
VTGIVKEMQPTYTWLTKDMVRDHLKTRSKRDRLSGSIAPLSAEEMATNTIEWNRTHATSTTLSTMSRDSGYTSIVRMADDLVGNLREITPAEGVPAQQAGVLIATGPITYGRPKGSTLQHSLDVKRRIRLATTDVAKLYSSALEENKRGSRQSTPPFSIKEGVLYPMAQLKFPLLHPDHHLTP